MATIRSTGQKLPEPEEPLLPEELRRFRDPMRNPRNRMAEELARARDEQTTKQEFEAHDKAVAAFDYAYGDVIRNPHLLNEVVRLRQGVIEEAARKREVIDWGKAYPEIGERVRERAGLPSGSEQHRQEVLNEVQRSRGQKQA